MKIVYDDKTDLRYLRLDDRTQELENRRVSEDIGLDIGESEKLLGSKFSMPQNMWSLIACSLLNMAWQTSVESVRTPLQGLLKTVYWWRSHFTAASTYSPLRFAL